MNDARYTPSVVTELARAALEAVRVSVGMAQPTLSQRAEWLAYCLRTTDVAFDQHMGLFHEPTWGNVGRIKKLRADALSMALAEPALSQRLGQWPHDIDTIRQLQREALAILQHHLAPEHPALCELRAQLSMG